MESVIFVPYFQGFSIVVQDKISAPIQSQNEGLEIEAVNLRFALYIYRKEDGIASTVKDSSQRHQRGETVN